MKTPTSGRSSPHLQTEPFNPPSLSRERALHVTVACSPGSQKVVLSHFALSCCISDVVASFLTQDVPHRNKPTHLCMRVG